MRKTLTTLTLGGLTALGAAGCTRPVVENHKEFYGKFNPTDVNQGDSMYKAHILTVMDEEYFLHRTPDGRIAMFKLADATRIVDQPRNPLSKKDRKAEVRLVSGESMNGELGVYVLVKEEGDKPNAKDKYLDGVELTTEGERRKVAVINKPNRKDIELAVRKSTEQDCRYNLPTVNLPGLGECYVVAAGKQLQRPGQYNFHIIPVENSRLIIDKNGKITIENENSVYRPTFNSNKHLEELKAKADAEAEAKRIADEKAAEAKKAEDEKNAKEAADKEAEAEKLRKGIPSTSEQKQN